MSHRYQASLGELFDTGTPLRLGVRASRDLYAGEVVEVAPVVQLRCDFESLDGELQRRVFSWHRLANMPGVHALAFGYASLYNHANPANMRYAAVANGEAIIFIAARDIPAGSELTINYNGVEGGTTSKEDNWFTDAGITPIDPLRSNGV